MNRMPTPTQSGFSLVELMVSSAIGLLLLTGVGTIYIESRATFRQQEVLARMQEGARYAFEVMALEIRQAGYTGCVPPNQIFSSLNPTVPVNWFDNLANPLMGFESGLGLPADVTGALANTDAVGIIRTDDSGNYRVAPGGHTPSSSANIELISNVGLVDGEILTAVDANCLFASTFQVTSLPSATRVQHNPGAGAPGNSTVCLGDPAGGPGSPCSIPATFPPLSDNSKIMRTVGTIFFIGTGVSTEPALFRENLATMAGAAVSTAEELVEGVENMQILYGEDSVAPADGNVDQYVTADAVGTWENVLAVRVSLLMRSVQNNVVNQPQAVEFNGATVNSGAGADRRLRKVFTATFALRNRPTPP